LRAVLQGVRKTMRPKAPKHKRIKPKGAADPNKVEQAHIDRVLSYGCLVCGREAVPHHIMHMKGKARRRDHRFVVPLCHIEHHMGRYGVHLLGGEEAFRKMYDIDLVAWAVNAWEESN